MRGGGPPPLAGFHSLVHDGLPGKQQLGRCSRCSGRSRHPVHRFLPCGLEPREVRDWPAGWVARPGAPSPLGVPPLGRPSALGEALGAPGLARLPGFLCPDGKRLYTLRGAPSPSRRCGCECQTGRLLPKVTLSLPGWGGVTARASTFAPSGRLV